MGNGRLLFKTYLREIFVSLTLQKMMSNESVLCSVRPNRKIFSGKSTTLFLFLKIYLRLVFPFIRCLKLIQMQCTIVIGLANKYLGEMPLAGFHCIAAKKIRTVYLWLMNIGLYIESTCFFNFRVGNKFSYLGHPAIGRITKSAVSLGLFSKVSVHFFLPVQHKIFSIPNNRVVFLNYSTR